MIGRDESNKKMNNKKYSPSKFVAATVLVLWVFAVVGCQTTQTGGVRDYSQGIDIAVAASTNNPAYRITETVGPAGYGYAYLVEKANGRWRVMYDSYDAKAFAKPAAGAKEVPVGTEVLWTDGKVVAVYFGTAPLSFSRQDGSFICPETKAEPGHRACRSQLTEAKSVFDALSIGKGKRPFVLDLDEIQEAVADTGIVGIAKKRLAREK